MKEIFRHFLYFCLFAVCLLNYSETYGFFAPAKATTWDGSAWSNGAADWTKDDVTITGDLTMTGPVTPGSLTIGSGATLTTNGIGTNAIGSGVTLTINDGGTWDITVGDLEFSNGSVVDVLDGGSLAVGGNFNNKNNSNSVTIDGGMDVIGTFDNGTGGVISGGGSISAGGAVTNNGTIGTSTGNDLGTLPVELLTVSASIQESGVMVSWETAIELNNEYFLLERSYDGLRFEEITKIEGAGNSNEPLTYQVLDIPPAYGLVIYRLSQTDFDGTTEIFPLFNILYQDLKETKVLAYPTRIPADLKEVKINNIWGTVISHDLRVVEMNGQVSAALLLDFDAEDVKILLPSTGKAGLHFLRGTINGVTISEKLIFLN